MSPHFTADPNRGIHMVRIETLDSSEFQLIPKISFFFLFNFFSSFFTGPAQARVGAQRSCGILSTRLFSSKRWLPHRVISSCDTTRRAISRNNSKKRTINRRRRRLASSEGSRTPRACIFHAASFWPLQRRTRTHETHTHTLTRAHGHTPVTLVR